MAFYTCNDRVLLHNWIHNGFAPPWYGHGAGGDVYAYLDGARWECDGPSSAVWSTCHALRERNWHWLARDFGCYLPVAQWNFPDRVDGLVMPTVVLPLWIFVAAAALFYFLTGRRAPVGHCRSCGYNLTGNVSGVCPECGKTIGKSG